MSHRTIGREALDFFAHASCAFVALCWAYLLGSHITDPAAIMLAWAYGFVREFTEWQDGGRHPFTLFGILDQLGWIAGGVAFTIIQ